VPETPDHAGLRQEARAFRDHFRSVVLATSSADGQPDASYAPVVFDEQETPHVYISELAQHTRNLLENPRASLLFIADESDTRNLFGRQRLTLHCEARRIDPADPQATLLLDQFEHSFGKTVQLLRSLGDFHLFAFEVRAGTYVRGFAQAWEIADASLNIVKLNRG